MKQPFNAKTAKVGDVVYTPNGIRGIIKSTDRDNVFYPVSVEFSDNSTESYTKDGYFFLDRSSKLNYRLSVEVPEINIHSLRESFEALQKKTDELINQLQSLLNDLQQNIPEDGKETDNNN